MCIRDSSSAMKILESLWRKNVQLFYNIRVLYTVITRCPKNVGPNEFLDEWMDCAKFVFDYDLPNLLCSMILIVPENSA